MVESAKKFDDAQRKLAKLNRDIDDVREQWLISTFINPLTFRQRELERERRNVRAELRRLGRELGIEAAA